MRLAIIDHKMGMECDMFLRYLDIIGGIEYACSVGLEDFEKKYGELDSYDFLLMHPGITMQNYYLIKIPERYPNLKFGFISVDSDSYCESDVPVFYYGNPKKITDFLLKKKK